MLITFPYARGIQKVRASLWLYLSYKKYTKTNVASAFDLIPQLLH
jgi:hypothetical protein